MSVSPSCHEGDALTVTKPVSLARSTAKLLSIEADLAKCGIGLVVLSMGGERLDTRKLGLRHQDGAGLPRCGLGSRLLLRAAAGLGGRVGAAG